VGAGLAINDDPLVSGNYLSFLETHNLTDLEDMFENNYFHATICSSRDNDQDGSAEFYLDETTNPVTGGLMAFNPTNFESEETDTAITFTVIRYGSDSPTSVSYSTPQNTEDIIPTSGILNWTAGDADPKTFNVTIVDDNYKEEDEVFSIFLYTPTNGAGIEYPKQEAFLTILANDHGGTVETIPPHLPLIFR